MPQKNTNVIVNFVLRGKDLLSDEGKELIRNTDRSIISEAAVQDSFILRALLSARENSPDPVFRRKILLSISD